MNSQEVHNERVLMIEFLPKLFIPKSAFLDIDCHRALNNNSLIMTNFIHLKSSVLTSNFMELFSKSYILIL